MTSINSSEDDNDNGNDNDNDKCLLKDIPNHLRIRVLYSDDDVIVIDKPRNLRSVPGHAKPPPTTSASSSSSSSSTTTISSLKTTTSSTVSKTKSTVSTSTSKSTSNKAPASSRKKRPRIESTTKMDEVDTMHDNDNERKNERKTNTKTTTMIINDNMDDKKCRRTAQEAWVLAIQSFKMNNNGNESNGSNGNHVYDSKNNKSNEKIVKLERTDDHNNEHNTTINQQQQQEHQEKQCLNRLAQLNEKKISSIPRKYKLFRRYFERNQKWLLLLEEETQPSTTISTPSSLSSLTGRGGHTKNDYKSNTIGTKNNLDKICQNVFQQIESRQRPLMNLPEPTKHDESALGQLILMGYGRSTINKKTENDNSSNSEGMRTIDCLSHGLYIVHRLDCETSGVMVFARNEYSASYLSKAWRERNRVTKKYLAAVERWSPLIHNDRAKVQSDMVGDDDIHDGCVFGNNHDDDDVENKTAAIPDEGIINIPLAPSEERLKWKVDKVNGKPSITRWKICHTAKLKQKSSLSSSSQQRHSQQQQKTQGKKKNKSHHNQNDDIKDFNGGNNENDGIDDSTFTTHHKPIVLELQPITGRTHQLRIHCAYLGSSIVGDSLYGTATTPMTMAIAARTETNQNSTENDDNCDDDVNDGLHLHAWYLSFPHPNNKNQESNHQLCQFSSMPSWLISL